MAKGSQAVNILVKFTMPSAKCDLERTVWKLSYFLNFQLRPAVMLNLRECIFWANCPDDGEWKLRLKFCENLTSGSDYLIFVKFKIVPAAILDFDYYFHFGPLLILWMYIG